jgi:hypothetical protein
MNITDIDTAKRWKFIGLVAYMRKVLHFGELVGLLVAKRLISKLVVLDESLAVRL